MISLFNTDSSYFKITSPDITARRAVLEKDVISLTVEEESGRGKITTGSIQLLDPGNNYSRILRAGARLNIEWGYNNLLPSKPSIIGAPLELGPPAFGPQARFGLQALIQNPSGSGSDNGQTTFSVNFFGSEARTEKQRRVYSNTARGVIVAEVMARLGVLTPIITFTDAVIPIGPNEQIVQRESDYQFLRRLAGEWRCLFRIGYTPAGTAVGMFADYNQIPANPFNTLTTGNIGGNYFYLNYKNSPSNTISYTWNQKAGIDGGGDNVRIITDATGRPQFFRTVAVGEKVITYKFRPERVSRELRTAQGLDRVELLIDWLSVTDFDKVRKFFDEVEQGTAPQGYGYEIGCKVRGNPLITPPMKIVFGDGFPSMFASVNELIATTNFYCNKATHTIDRSGYFCNLQIMDALSITGGSFI